MVEGGGLENRYILTGIEGSNPSLSAICILPLFFYQHDSFYTDQLLRPTGGGNVFAAFVLQGADAVQVSGSTVLNGKRGPMGERAAEMRRMPSKCKLAQVFHAFKYFTGPALGCVVNRFVLYYANVKKGCRENGECIRTT